MQMRIIAGAIAASLFVTGVAVAKDQASLYREQADDPPAREPASANLLARSAGGRQQVGGYVSVQVNVDGAGFNILGDAANEPSIAVDPNNRNNIVIGWRQFDNVASNFRQAGVAWSHDGGQSWTFPGVLTPGVFRSDPVLDTDSGGAFFYQSLQESFVMDVFRSADSGESWAPPVFSFGGDKNWMSIDRSGGTGDGNIYGIWQRFFGCCGQNTLTRSTDGGQNFEPPVAVALRPTFGTMAVGPDGELYAAGIDGTVTQNLNQFVVTRSEDAQNPAVPPSSTGVQVDLGGSMEISVGPNPGGLLGQANVAVDHSPGPTRGNVYLLASVDPAGGADPLDVHLARSTDGGSTWSAPIRVNDDSFGHWQWFGAHSVGRDGRVDVIWNDTRNSGQSSVSELFYAWSYDAGQTWFGNQPVSPAFDSFLGWPNQSKLGDYYTIDSDETGADVAYAATFNGEQDVYYLRLFPDCNGNGTSDVTDIETLASADDNANHVPDECEFEFVLLPPDPGATGVENDFLVLGATPGENIVYVRGAVAGATPVPGCAGIELAIANPRILARATADADGEANVTRFIPPALSGQTRLFQALERSSCSVTAPVTVAFP